MPSASRLSALVVRLHASGEVDDVGEPCCVKKFGGLFAPSPAAAQHDRASVAVEFGDSFGEVAEWMFTVPLMTPSASSSGWRTSMNCVSLSTTELKSEIG